MAKERKVSEYSTFGGRNEFRNAHTGEVQKSVTIDWSPKGLFATTINENDIDQRYKLIITNLPDVIHLSKFEDYQYEHELPYIQDNINKEELYNVSYGTLVKINKYINEGSM